MKTEEQLNMPPDPGEPSDLIHSPDDPSEPEVVEAGSRQFGTKWLALAVLVGLLLGYLAGVLTPSIRAPGDTSAEAGFARDMSLHHGQAVEMALIIYQKSDDPEVLDIAFDVITNQQGQMGTMRRWLDEWRLSPNTSRPRMAWMPDGAAAMRNGRMPGMASDEDVRKLGEATGRQADTLFVQLMLRHHIGGVHMAEGVLKQTDRPEVVKLAQVMKDSQQREITIFRAMLDKLGAQPI